jgi:hypothetical protein
MMEMGWVDPKTWTRLNKFFCPLFDYSKLDSTSNREVVNLIHSSGSSPLNALTRENPLLPKVYYPLCLTVNPSITTSCYK